MVAGLFLIAGLAWAYMLYLAQDMRAMMIPLNQSWSAGDFGFQFTMWAVMMIAMMTPSATPMILTFTTIQRRRRDNSQTYVPTSVFLAGYIAMWAGFAAAATTAQWALHSASLLSPMMESTNAYLGGVILLAGGAFQLSPLKQACLSRCVTPLGFIMTEWRDGIHGALRMGLKHGSFCIGCCWALMALLFVTGVMSLVWVAIIAGFVLVEKATSRVRWVSWVSATVLLTLAVFSFAGGLN